MNHRFARNLCNIGSAFGLVLAFWGFWQGFAVAIAGEVGGLAIDRYAPHLPPARMR